MKDIKDLINGIYDPVTTFKIPCPKCMKYDCKDHMPINKKLAKKILKDLENDPELVDQLYQMISEIRVKQKEKDMIDLYWAKPRMQILENAEDWDKDKSHDGDVDAAIARGSTMRNGPYR